MFVELAEIADYRDNPSGTKEYSRLEVSKLGTECIKV